MFRMLYCIFKRRWAALKRQFRAKVLRRPVDYGTVLFLELTRKCNQRCDYCYADAGPHESECDNLSFEETCAVLDSGIAQGFKTVSLIGGEPLLHPRLIDIVAHAKVTGYSVVEVATNGTLFTDEIIDGLKKNGARVAITLLSKDPRIHDAMVGLQGSHAKVVRAAKRLVKRRVRTRANIIVDGRNVAGRHETEKFLNSLGIHEVTLDVIRAMGRGAEISDFSAFSETCTSCVQSKVCVTPCGDVLPCNIARKYVVGNVKQSPLEHILSPEVMGRGRGAMAEEIAARQDQSRHLRCGCGPYSCTPNPSRADVEYELPLITPVGVNEHDCSMSVESQAAI